jgi:putative ABC transport system permease protein
MNPPRLPENDVRPPRILTALCGLLLDHGSREAVLGDLDEGYANVHRRGVWAARWWYAVQALRSVVSCRITGRRRADERLFDEEPGARPNLRDLLRPALRQFRDHPLYAFACVSTLALAVGASCVSFAVVKRAFLDPLPYRDDHELVSLMTVMDGSSGPVSPHVLVDLRASNPPLVEFAPIRPTGAAFTTADSTETIAVSYVDLEYFTLVGVAPAQGRVWTRQEPDAIVVSTGFWINKLGRRPDVVGTAITVDGRARTIVGVMPHDYKPPYFSITDAWAPIDMPALLADIRTRRTLTVLARRAPDATPSDLGAYMALFSRQVQERFPQMHAGQTWAAKPLRGEIVGSAQPALLGTAGAAALLLLIVGANIAGLSTAHAMSMRHQLAVRAALGATRRRLFVGQLVDSLVLAAAGSLAGVWIASGLIELVAQYQQYFLAGLPSITLDAATVSGGLLAGLVIGLTAALLPRSVVNAAPGEALRSARGSSADVKVTTTRAALVVAQVAIALVLLVGAGLLVRTVAHLSERELGFDSDGLAWLQVTLPGQRYQSPESQIQFESDVLDRLRHMPGVKSAIASVGFPLWGGMMAGLAMKSDGPTTPRREVAYLSVAPNFVRDVGARLVAGRDLLPSDNLNTTRVVVINETMAQMFWPKGDALNAEVQIGPGSPNERWITVVGIMADMRAHGLTQEIRPTAFGTTRQYSWPRRHLAVRFAGAPPPTLAADLKAVVHGLDPTVAIGVITTAEQNLTNAMARHRLVMLALSVFGGVALVLCISGLYAVIVLNSQQRRREYAIRVALGAQRGGVRWMVVRQALFLALAGALTGVVVAALGTQALQGLLHGVQPIDVPTFIFAGLTLLVLAMLAAWQPARQAERVDPVEALRAE